MQKKQIIQFAVLLVFLAAMVGAYFGIKSYNTAQEEKEQQEQEDSKIILTSFQPDDITEISYDYNGTTYSFEKTDDIWKSRDDDSLDIDQDAFEDFLKSAGDIQAQTEVTVNKDADESGSGDAGKEDEDYGFDEPTRTVTITTDKGASSLTFGMKNEMLGQYYIKTSEGSRIYLVEESVYTAFDKDAETFKKTESSDTDDASDTDDKTDTDDASDTER